MIDELFDIQKIRERFPAINQTVYGKPLVYLDNGATSQKPQVVIDAIRNFSALDNANVHRGVHALSMRADKAYEEARDNVQRFINAASRKEVIFTKGTTESINLVAFSFGQAFVKPGDEIIITEMEHHANIVPWQQMCERTGATLKVVPILDNGTLDMQAFADTLSDKTRLVSVTHVSNTLGTINPIEQIIEMAHDAGAFVLIDAAQSIQHMPTDVQKLNCDFLVFSSHKMYGPDGVGILYGKQSLLERMPPYQTGGAMISEVTFEKTTFNELPYKFEAGTPNISGVIGLGAAVEFIESIGLDVIASYEALLTDYMMNALKGIPGLTIYGHAQNRVGVVSFTLDGIHAHDIATILDRKGVAVRAGHHCTMPLMKRFNVAATVRASVAMYNTVQDIDALVSAIKATIKVFAHE